MARKQRRRIRYAQNFLKHAQLARRLVAASSITKHDLVVEIGPGDGLLTKALSDTSHQVVTIEKDPVLSAQLSKRLTNCANVVLYEADALDMPLPLTPYKVFASIPFNITAAIVDKLLDAPNVPIEASLVMQRQAAERFLGSPKTTLASLLIHPWFERTIVHWFRRTDFVPPPRVDVVLLRFSKRGPPLIAGDEAQRYRDVVTYGFTAWKPTVHAAYRDVFTDRDLTQIAATSGVDLDRKPGDVDPDEWIVLFRAIAKRSSRHQRRHFQGAEQRLRDQQARLQKEHRTRVRQ